MDKKQGNMPLISIIIPTYNEEKYIEKCIASLERQTFKNIEIIIIDDGSTDSTPYIASNMNVKLSILSHGGPGRAKNYGAKIASGEILVFIDGDMVLHKNYIENIISPILKKKCVCTYTIVEYVKNIENIWSKCWNINSDLRSNQRIQDNNQTNGQSFRAIVKKRFLDTLGFDPKLGYIDDKSLTKYNIFATPVSNAICYHYNPDTLREVYFSARWIGRSMKFKFNLRNLLRYSIVNSLKISLEKIHKGAPLLFMVFKIFFDFGIFTGLLCKNSRNNFSK